MNLEDLKNSNWLTNKENFNKVEQFHLEEMKKRENEKPKFKIIGNPLDDEIQNVFKNKNIVNILGKGPSLQKIEENNNQINYCINNSIEVQENCDILFLGDIYILYHLFFSDKDLFKNVKILMMLAPAHGFSRSIEKKYDINFIVNLLKCSSFNGILLPFTTLPIKKYNGRAGIKVRASVSGVNSVFVLEMLKLTNREINYYGVSIPGMSKEKVTGYHQVIQETFHQDFLNTVNVNNNLMFNNNLVKILNYLKIKYKFH